MKTEKTTGMYLSVIPCKLHMPTFNARGKLIGTHDYPVHLLTTGETTDQGGGVAWVFDGEQAATKLAGRHNFHDALVAALTACANCINPLLTECRDDDADSPFRKKVLEIQSKARAALALVRRASRPTRKGAA